MCGITAYIGDRNPVPILLKGLKRLEYRGYDSAGLALIKKSELTCVKKSGKVSTLESLINNSNNESTSGIAHTRWATHGEPNDINAHPHLDHTGNIALVHNGIIENYDVLKEVLKSKGVTFTSDTDSEVLVHLISTIFYQDKKISFEDAVRAALQETIGAYGIVAICLDEPDNIIAARNGSPLVIGVGNGEYFLASDASPIVEHTRNVIFLGDGEIANITKNKHTISKIDSNQVISKALTELDLSIEEKTLSLINDAKTILWNGPVGVFENDLFAEGTRCLSKAISKSEAFSLAGGGETLSAINKYINPDDVSYCSTGGGAFLEFMEGKTLPSIKVLNSKETGS